MRVLFLTQYFTPELTAGAARLHAFAAYLGAHGDEVEVICEVPNHPLGVVQAGYGGRAIDRRRFDGFGVTYVWVPTNPKKTTATRLANYGGYAAMAAIAGAFRRRPDVVFASSPPLPVGAAGNAVARVHRVPWVLDVRDLWPAAAVAVGELRGRRPIAAMETLERRLYRSADAITTPSESAAEQIRLVSGRPEKVFNLPSGTTAEWLRLGEAPPDRDALGVAADVFAWTYAGNVGLAQDLATAVEAAALLGPGFQLTIVGDGPSRAEVERLAAKSAGSGLVRFTGLMPKAQAGVLMRASDALLVSLADSPGIEYAVPSKLYDCCAVGRPVIVASAGEASRMTDRHSIGIAVRPGDPEALAGAVRTLRGNAALRDRLSMAGMSFARDNLRELQGGRLADILRGVAAPATVME